MNAVILVRHGRTAWNRSRFLGRADMPLDDVGRQQALAAAERVSHLLAARSQPSPTVWSSPLNRARDTADPIAARFGVPICLADDLVELDCGDWEGQEKGLVGRKVGKLPVDQPVPGGESALDVWRRVGRFLVSAGLAERSGELSPVPRHPTVIVAHHQVNKLLYAALLGRGLDEALLDGDYRPRPGSVLLLEPHAGGWRPTPSPVLEVAP